MTKYYTETTETVEFEAITVTSSPQHAVMAFPKQPSASNATREVDDLMASLSDFKVKNKHNGYGRVSPKPPAPAPSNEPLGSQLDDLMASLSDFKMKDRRNDYGRVSPKPQQAPLDTVLGAQLDDLMASLSEFKLQERQKAAARMSPKPIRRPISPAPAPVPLDSLLGNLQSDLSRQGVETIAKGFCYCCHKPIVGQVVTALGKTWHPEHFTCVHCGCELGTKNFFERENEPYCETDYHNLFSPRCGYCNASILDKCVSALDKTWHPEHFFCAHCGKQFTDDGFHEKDGKPYCREDYFDLFAPKCGGCNTAITDNYISALNAQWHPDCFVCRDCRCPFVGGSFFDHEGQPYCETHYHAKRGSLCAGCHKPIAGRCITAMFRKFHPEHFVCSFCLKQLNKGTFKEQNDKPYCHPCFDKLFS